ncbi:MAG: shc 2 [Verrucomicrobiaceae bacterium]|nr:shc 2 [Verrucomicrobiaceae bacterium]
MDRLDQAIASTRSHLLSLMNAEGHWEGELSSSALSTATAVVALWLVDASAHASYIQAGARWLEAHQNEDGGWGDTAISKSNLSTTLLCWAALGRAGGEARTEQRCEAWITQVVGSLEPERIARAVTARYGKDKTFSVPILMMATLGGRLGENAWRRVLALPFELAVFPRAWFGAIGLPVVSYALPALIAIGHARFCHAPPARWSPLYWLRRWAWTKVRPMLTELHPSSGGYLEATPLTSFVTMALAGAGEKHHPCVPKAVEFLQRSMRADGSWPIDTNLAIWGTTLSIKALDDDLSRDQKLSLKKWLLSQQYTSIHPFTNAAPGGWAWTHLPGGVPDADDTAGTLIALHMLGESDAERQAVAPQAKAGVKWLLGLQNRDGGMPTFCRGWGTLPFDRSSPELSAHALWAWRLWKETVPEAAVTAAVSYLKKAQLKGSAAWEPLWFGNEHTAEETNPVYGTAQVLSGLFGAGFTANEPWIKDAIDWLAAAQHVSGGWGGSRDVAPSLEETSVVLKALAQSSVNDPKVCEAIRRGVDWLLNATAEGTQFNASPIGLYFARLWYHETLYPVIWTLSALKAVRSHPH